MFAGACETDITPPIGVALTEPELTVSGSIHDPLYARAIVFDNGRDRAAIVAADLAPLPTDFAEELRRVIATEIGGAADAVLIACSGTFTAPALDPDRGPIDMPYRDVLRRKLIGAAKQAASALEPVHLVFGQAPAQIGVGLAPGIGEGRRDYGAPVDQAVRAVCVNGSDGRLMALLFSHGCAVSGGALGTITAGWPGEAASWLKRRFRQEAAEGGVREDALPIFLQGCCESAAPVKSRDWSDARDAGRQIAEAAHTARWNAHGRLADSISFQRLEVGRNESDSLRLPPLPVHCLNIAGVNLIAAPTALGIALQIELAEQVGGSLICISYGNGSVRLRSEDSDAGSAGAVSRPPNWPALAAEMLDLLADSH